MAPNKFSIRGIKMLTEEDCIFPKSSGDKGTGLETDIPDLDKKIQNAPKAKLVLNMGRSS